MAAVIVASVGAFAQPVTKAVAQKPRQGVAGPNFVDANGDGICDNFAARRGGQGRGFGRGMGAGFGAGLAFGRNGQSLIDVTARVTGIAPGDVRAALRDGQTFARIAEGHGKSAQDLVQAALTARQEMLATAVSEGRLTQAQADQVIVQMKTRLEARVSSATQPRGRGFRGQCPIAGTVPVAPIRK
jgi:hypothetical protein